MAHWNWLDWVFATIVLVSVVTAIWKGFVAELISLASAIAALIVAALGYERLAPLLSGITSNQEVALGASFILLFAAVLVIGALVSIVAKKLVKKVQLQWFDRFLGGIFGLVRGLLVDCIVLLVMMTFAIKQAAIQKSVLAPYVTVGSELLAVVMPKDMKSDFRAGVEKFKQELNQTGKKAIKVHSAGKTSL
jgi:membrane protein required for colicin V production